MLKPMSEYGSFDRKALTRLVLEFLIVRSETSLESEHSASARPVVKVSSGILEEGWIRSAAAADIGYLQ